MVETRKLINIFNDILGCGIASTSIITLPLDIRRKGFHDAWDIQCKLKDFVGKNQIIFHRNSSKQQK